MSCIDALQFLGLTHSAPAPKKLEMTKTLPLLTLVAAAALAGCNKSSHTITANSPDDAAVNTAATPVEMPPAIVSSKIYRCKDNTLVYIDWLADNKGANFRAKQGEAPTVLTPEAPGGALKAEGYSLIGLPTAKTISLTRPGTGEQACKA
jgi:hypothetical protein